MSNNNSDSHTAWEIIGLVFIFIFIAGGLWAISQMSPDDKDEVIMMQSLE